MFAVDAAVVPVVDVVFTVMSAVVAILAVVLFPLMSNSDCCGSFYSCNGAF
jgi:hypothetical protein